jgi:colanic acid/amylovoran biosynthesis glycosyltransferase
MKVGYLVNTYPRPSHSFIRREVQALERQGWTVHRFAMRSDRAALVDPADIAEDGRTEHVLKAGALGLLGSALKWMIRRPMRALSALRLALTCGARANARAVHLVYWIEAAHVAHRAWELRLPHIHAHFGTNSTTVAMLAQAMGGPSFSFTVHGPEEFDAPEALSLGEKVRRAAFVVAISNFGRSQLCRWSDPADWSRIQVVPCGIEPWRFAEPAPVPPGGPDLIAVGRLAPQKGFPLLVEAVALAARDLPGVQVTLVGDGPLAPSLRAQAARAGIADRITFAGWQDEAGVRAALAAAQALILPSFAEGLPVVVMEAMAAGRPVIATLIAGVPELVTPDTGWLVPAGDAAALADAMRALSATPTEQIAAMGQAARVRVLARHDVDAAAARLALLFAGKGGS